MSDLSKEDALALLAFYQDAGVSEAIGEHPFNRLAAQAAPMAEPVKTVKEAPLAARAVDAHVRPSAAIQSEAESLARSAHNLEELKNKLESFNGCALKPTATQLVFSDGNPAAPLLIIGEAPGREEDLEGKPFVGASGRLLNRMLAAIGLDREQCYITNVVYWRPPGNRTPTLDEVAACRPFLLRQMELQKPKVILLLGAVATQAVLESHQAITRQRGQWREISVGGAAVPVLVSYHPSYLLRQPGAKRDAWRDMLALQDKLKSLAP